MDAAHPTQEGRLPLALPALSGPAPVTTPGFKEYLSDECEGFARNYLAQYYGPPAMQDEIVIYKFLQEELNRLGRHFEQYVECGCGPTVHHALPFARVADRIVLSEYRPDNREEVARFIQGAPEAHNWDHYIAACIETEGAVATDEAVAARRELFRQKVDSICPTDIRTVPVVPVELTPNSVVGVFYVAEEVGTTIEDWALIVKNIADSLPVGAHLFMSSLRGMTEYVMTKDENGNPLSTLPCAPVTEEHYLKLLPELGFANPVVRHARIENPDCDVDGVVVVSATKTGPSKLA